MAVVATEKLHVLPTLCPTAQVDSLNRERKLQQHAAGSELGKLEAEYLGLVHKVGAGCWVLVGSLAGADVCKAGGACAVQ